MPQRTMDPISIAVAAAFSIPFLIWTVILPWTDDEIDRYSDNH